MKQKQSVSELKRKLEHEFHDQFGDASDQKAAANAKKLVKEIFKKENAGYKYLIVDTFNELETAIHSKDISDSQFERASDKFSAAVNGAAWTFLHDHS